MIIEISKLLKSSKSSTFHKQRYNFWRKVYTQLYKKLVEPFVRWKNLRKDVRYLELGPGDQRIPNFETFNIYKTPVTDYIGDLSGKLPFSDETFDIVYASHILEHVPWYNLDSVFSELYRITKLGGRVEVWVPDGYKISKAFVEAEDGVGESFKLDKWFRFNPDEDPAIWAAGRFFSYGDGYGTPGHPNWHLSLFSPRLLSKLFIKSGFSTTELLDHSECRGYDHGWINLGVKAIKL